MVKIILMIIVSLFVKPDNNISILGLYRTNFSKNDFFKVKMLNDMFLIVSSEVKTVKRNDEKLSLIAKKLLYKYLKKNDVKLSSIEVKNFTSTTKWSTSYRNFMLSYIHKKNIKKIYLKQSRKKSLVFLEKIKELEAIKKKDIHIHEQLKNLYLKINDINNYEKEMSIIINLKFKSF